MSQNARLAVDIGGTFTDLVLEHDGATTSAKVLTTPAAPEQGVIAGASSLLDAQGVAPAALQLVIHGTTLATNALIERKGARAALVTTEGFRDSIEIAYEHRFEQYDLYMERPEPLVPRYWRFGVPERMAADGSVMLPLDEAAFEKLARELEAEGIESIAVSFLHSYANPAHELRAGALLEAALPGVPVTLSHEVCPEIREYERTSTTAANAYVLPLIAGYLARLEDGLKTIGIEANLLLMMSSGAITTIDTAKRQPIRLVESGPAGGAILAAGIAAQNECPRALAFDMGGTTAKLALIDDYRPQYSRSFEVARAYRFLKGSGLPLRIPVIDMVEIGTGGGSIARLDALEQVVVGPESAGAAPGPACYDLGGEAATVTDADLVLGRIDPARFAGGMIHLQVDKASDAMAGELAQTSKLSITGVAANIAEIVDENMASAARVHAVENGKDTADRTMIAFGGAAPLHAGRLAEKLGIARVIVPKGAGVGSAHGFLSAPLAFEVVRTRLIALPAFDFAEVNGIFDAMRAEAEAVVRLGAPSGDLTEERTAFMRYRGQGHEISVLLPVRPYTDDDVLTMQQRFDDAYAELFGRVIPDLEVEILTWTLSLSTEGTPPEPVGDKAAKKDLQATEIRKVFDTAVGRRVDCAVHQRQVLAPGDSIKGPALIVEAETTTVVPSSFDATINAVGQIVLTRKEGSR